MLSEKVLFAMNNLDSEQIEEAGLSMGYIKKGQHRRRTGMVKRILLIAAVIAALLAMSAAVYSIGRLWSKGVQQQVQATEQQEQQLIDDGQASVFTGEEKAVSCSGVTIKPLELITDEYNIWISFAIDGFVFEDGKDPCFMYVDWYIGDDPSSGRLNGSSGFWSEMGEDGTQVFTDADGKLEYILGLWGDYPYRPVLGQNLHVRFKDMGTAYKIFMTQTLEGEWSFEFDLPEESYAKTYTVNIPLEGTALTVGTVKLSPLSILIEYPVSGRGDPAEIIDTMPRAFHLKLADGTILENIAVGGETGYTDSSHTVAFHYGGLHQVIDPEQVAAVILSNELNKANTFEIPIQ